MLKLYTTRDILHSIMLNHDGQYDAWYNLIRKLKPEIWLNEEAGEDEELEKCLESVDAIRGHIEDPDFLSDVAAMKPESVDNAWAVFILDVDGVTAEKIAEKYGVICHPAGAPAGECPLFQEGAEIGVESKESGNWAKLISPAAVVPSNWLILIDRYLFSKNMPASEDGINNVLELLDGAIPKRLDKDAEFHILIISDMNTSEADIKKVADKINSRKSELKRPYRIVVEVVSVSDYNYKYEETHNRRILSNYYIVRAEHSLRAFKGNKALYSQTLSLDWIGSKGCINCKNSDLPGKSLKKSIRDVRDIVRHLKEEWKGDVPFVQNGRKADIKDIKHRMVNDR